MRRLVLALVLALPGVVVVWAGLDLPPPLWILKYGPAPGCEPTGRTWTLEGVKFVEIGPGISRMGSDFLTTRCVDDIFLHHGWTRGDLPGRIGPRVGIDGGTVPRLSYEDPAHWVQFPRGFAIAWTEITNLEYERFDPTHVRHKFSPGDRHPVVDVSWNDAERYCRWLAEKSGLPVRLPSESEWECACRGGTRTDYVCGDDPAGLDEFAWFHLPFQRRAYEVATKRPNAWGLHDMEGNVWEWCQDGWHESYLVIRSTPGPGLMESTRTVARAPDDGSAWVENSRGRVFRGGSWYGKARESRSASRSWTSESDFSYTKGFRPAFTPPDR